MTAVPWRAVWPGHRGGPACQTYRASGSLCLYAEVRGMASQLYPPGEGVRRGI